MFTILGISVFTGNKKPIKTILLAIAMCMAVDGLVFFALSQIH